MIHIVEEDALLDVTAIDQFNMNEEKAYFCVTGFDEVESMVKLMGIDEKITSECLGDQISKYENRDGYDFIRLNIPLDIESKKKSQRVCIYFSKNILLFIMDDFEIVNYILSEIQDKKIKNINLGRILHLFFYRLIFDDHIILDEIEQEILDVEEELILSKKTDLIDQFIVFRKKLMNLKRYYEQLLEISEAIEQNENDLLDKAVLKYFKFHTNRINRLYHSILNLREYVTQVREAYQAQIDINLNSIMKIFTVITAIFLPLTLIVGWYGMNLKMPETHWDFGYPFVIILSLLVAGGSLYYFKKNKWF